MCHESFISNPPFDTATTHIPPKSKIDWDKDIAKLHKLLATAYNVTGRYPDSTPQTELIRFLSLGSASGFSSNALGRLIKELIWLRAQEEDAVPSSRGAARDAGAPEIITRDNIVFTISHNVKHYRGINLKALATTADAAGGEGAGSL